jgi:photosystem II stability/assembly factor-like uncharacterized protein
MKRRFSYFLVLCSLITLVRSADGQWVQLKGPFSGYVTCFAERDSIIVAGTYGGTAVSTDTGATWTSRELFDDQGGSFINSLVMLGQSLFAGTADGVFVTDINQELWSGAPIGLEGENVLSLAVKDTKIFAGTSKGIFTSSDSGLDWVEADSGLKKSAINGLSIINSNLFAATDSGIFLSTDMGATWSERDLGLTNVHTLTLIFVGPYVFAGTNGNGVFFSIDSGMNWIPANEGMEKSNIYAFSLLGNDMFASSDSGEIFHSSDFGKSWSPMNTNLTFSVLALETFGPNLFAGTSNQGVSRSTDTGRDWMGVGFGGVQVNSFSMIGKTLYAGTLNGIYHSSDFGQSWLCGSGFEYNQALSLWNNGRVLLAGTNGSGLFRSNDFGKSWFQTGFDLDTSGTAELGPMASMGSLLFVATGDIYCSKDTGVTWENISPHLPGLGVISLTSLGNDLFAGTYDSGVYRSSDTGKSWEQVNSYLTQAAIYSMATFGNNILAGTWNGAYRSTDDGSEWSDPTPLLTKNFSYALLGVRSLVFSGMTSFAGDSGGVCYSMDSGVSWIQSSTGLGGSQVLALAADSLYIYAGTDEGVWRRPLAEFPLGDGGNSGVLLHGPSCSSLQSYPNPFSQRTTITFTSPDDGIAEVSVVNVIGQTVSQLFTGELSAGEHSFVWDATNTPVGTYFCVIRTSKTSRTIAMQHSD